MPSKIVFRSQSLGSAPRNQSLGHIAAQPLLQPCLAIQKWTVERRSDIAVQAHHWSWKVRQCLDYKRATQKMGSSRLGDLQIAIVGVNKSKRIQVQGLVVPHDLLRRHGNPIRLAEVPHHTFSREFFGIKKMKGHILPTEDPVHALDAALWLRAANPLLQPIPNFGLPDPCHLLETAFQPIPRCAQITKHTRLESPQLQKVPELPDFILGKKPPDRLGGEDWNELPGPCPRKTTVEEMEGTRPQFTKFFFAVSIQKNRPPRLVPVRERSQEQLIPEETIERKEKVPGIPQAPEKGGLNGCRPSL